MTEEVVEGKESVLDGKMTIIEENEKMDREPSESAKTLIMYYIFIGSIWIMAGYIIWHVLK